MDPGERVKALRKKRGLSQEQLGVMIGFSQSKISKIENGNCDSLSDLKLLAAALDVKLEDLVREEADGRDPGEEHEKKNSNVDEHKG